MLPTRAEGNDMLVAGTVRLQVLVTIVVGVVICTHVIFEFHNFASRLC